MKTIAILGRQPSLGIAELESLYGAEHLRPVGTQATLLDIAHGDIEFSRLGGSVKLGKILTMLETADWQKVQAYLLKTIPEHLQYLPEGKLKLGLSVYGLSATVPRINATALSLKKVIRNAGKSVRIVPNTTTELSSAQVLHNKLTGSLGWEFLIVRDGDKTILAQTVAVQDIDAYAARDQARPKRDARVGMLPPKLAQLIINLAVDKLTDGSKQLTVLDPFCGTGVVLQEALLMGYAVYGTDLDPRMVEYSQTNLNWLAKNYELQTTNYKLSHGDATNHEWPDLRTKDSGQKTTVACETYLGRPFSALPPQGVLEEVMRDVDIIHRKFLKNIARQTESGFRMCIAVPAWKTKSGFKHLMTLDSLEELGYTRQSFVHADDSELIYHREGQIVGRELVVLTRV